jgi:hypothetical protein
VRKKSSKSLVKLTPDELAERDLKLHELLKKKASAGKIMGRGALEVAARLRDWRRITLRITITICMDYRVDEGLWRRGLLHCLTECSRSIARARPCNQSKSARRLDCCKASAD